LLDCFSKRLLILIAHIYVLVWKLKGLPNY